MMITMSDNMDRRPYGRGRMVTITSPLIMIVGTYYTVKKQRDYHDNFPMKIRITACRTQVIFPSQYSQNTSCKLSSALKD